MISDIMKMMMEQEERRNEAEKILFEGGRTEEYKQEGDELNEKYPDYMRLMCELLPDGGKMGLQPFYALLEILPESVARYAVKTFDTGNRIISLQCNDILDKRFSKKEAESTENEPANS